MSFAEKLRVLRKEKGLTQEQLAEVLNVSRQSVSKWESGQAYPEIDKLIILSDLFKITVDDLIKDKNIESVVDKNDEGADDENEGWSKIAVLSSGAVGAILGIIAYTNNWLG